MAKNKQKSKRKQTQPTRVKTVVVQQPQQSIGAEIGSKVGDFLQRAGTSLFKTFMGMGDYVTSDNVTDIKQNALMGKYPRTPTFTSDGKGSFLFEHGDFVTDVVGSTSFASTVYDINPANSNLFKWLAPIAESFEYYRVEGMLVRFNSSSGNTTSGSTSLGTVMGAVMYDVKDSAFTSKTSLLQYEGAVSTKASENFLLGVECDPSRIVLDKLYVGATVPSNTDPRFYNLGKIVIATQGQQAANIVGELYIHYRIRFFVTKTLSPSGGLVGASGAWLGNSTSTTNVFNGASGPVMMYANPNADYTLSATFSGNTISIDTDVGGLYNVALYLQGNSSTATTFPTITYSGCTNVQILGRSVYDNFGLASTQYSVITLLISATAETASVTYSSIVGPGTTLFMNTQVVVSKLI